MNRTSERSPAGWSIPMCIAGGLLLFSGVLHVVVWWFDGGSLSGDVSWRKPILFGFSAGATMLSLGWLVGKMRPWFGDRILFIAFSVAMLTEVGLITLQQWRGVASHFNSDTAFDASVLGWIESLILFATIVIAYLTVRSFGVLRASGDMKLAIRSGMSLLLFACLLGFVLVEYGNQQKLAGKSPGIYGEAGVMKFPHGMPLHAIQYFPFVAWCLNYLGVKENLRSKAVTYTMLSVTTFTLFSLIQTFSGKARFDVGWVSGSILFFSFVLLSLPFAIGMQAMLRFSKTPST